MARRSFVCAVVLLLACTRKDKPIGADPAPDSSTPPVVTECRDERVVEGGRVVWEAEKDAGTQTKMGRFEPRFVAIATASRLSSHAIGRAACRASSALRACGGDAHERTPEFQGTLLLSLDVVGSKLMRAARLGGNANDLGIEKCAIEALRAGSFDSDANGPALLSIEWLPRLWVTKITEHFIGLSGKLPFPTVRAAIVAHYPTLRQCYEEARKRDPALDRFYVLPKFVIDEAGKPTGVFIDHGPLKDAVLEKCIVAVFEKITFPAPSSGKVQVVWPVEFSWELE